MPWSLTYDVPICGYERLSEDRNGDKFGYDVQEGGGNGWAERAHATIDRWYADRNETAADPTVTRKGFEQMLADVAAGMYRGIVVWRMDRLVRQPVEFAKALAVVNSVGGFIYSTDEGLDSRDEQALPMMWMKVIMGEAEVKGTKRRIKANKNYKAKAGLYTGGGFRPYGFEAPVRDGRGKVTNSGRCGVMHVPAEVANLREAARRIAREGDDYLGVIRDWHSRTPPVYGATGAPWNTKTLEHLLTSPRMVGRQEWRDPESGRIELVSAVWEPVLDEATWRILVERRAARKNSSSKQYNTYGKYLLTRIAECGRCGGVITGSQRSYRRAGGVLTPTRTYRCPSGAPYKARGSCGRLNVLADEVEKVVVAKIIVRVRRTGGLASELDDLSGALRDELALLADRRVECVSQLDEVKVAYRARRISMADWLEVREPVQAEVDALDGQMKVLASRLNVPIPVGAELKDLPGWFESLSFAQRRTLVEAHVERVAVLPPGRSGRYFRPERVVVTLTGSQESQSEGE